MHVNDLLKTAVEAGASDLHLKVGSYPMMRVKGSLVPASEDKRLDPEDLVAMSSGIMSAVQRQKFKETQEIDLIDLVENRYHGLLDDLVFQNRDA